MKKRAFIKYNKKGIIAPGSLVITDNFPSRSGNVWHEVPTHLLGGTTLTSSFDVTSLPWAFVPYSTLELGMGCMSDKADWLYVYAPLNKDLVTPADVVNHLNTKMSFLGTYELGKLDGNYQEVIFNLSPQLTEDLNKPGPTGSSQFCGFGINYYVD